MTLPEPFARFQEWWKEARAVDPGEHTDAMVVSSVSSDGRPASRVVLLRGFDARGFVFYTNYQSRKGRELLAHPFAALNIYWPKLDRQVRVEGRVEQVADDEADVYFRGRPRDSQLGAWASDQSRPLKDRAELIARLDAVRTRFDGQPVPRPPHWSGFRVVPDAIELWHAGEFRLHQRERYERAADGIWSRTLLFP